MGGTAPIVITGATSGIGRAAAEQLARRGVPLVLIGRDGTKARAVHADIQKSAGATPMELETADLSVQADIRRAAAAILGRHAAIGGLINNAGVIYRHRQLSADGIEMTFAVNHLAPFLLTNLLLDALKAGAPSRIVTTSSDHLRPLRLDDLERRKAYKTYDVYGETKLANILFTLELARRLAGTRVSANAVHPGFIRSSLFRDGNRLLRLGFVLAGPFIMESAWVGGSRLVYAAADPSMTGITGEYLVRNEPAKAIAPAYDTALAAQLWAISERMTGLVPGPTTS